MTAPGGLGQRLPPARAARGAGAAAALAGWEDAPGEDRPGWGDGVGGTDLGAPGRVGATNWGAGDLRGEGGDQRGGDPDPQGLGPPTAPAHCSAMQPFPSRYPHAPRPPPPPAGSSPVPICPPRSSCALAFVSQPCCAPLPSPSAPLTPGTSPGYKRAAT